MRLSILAVSLLVFPASAPAAPGQTIENAQLFLRQIVPAAQYKTDLADGSYNPRWGSITSVNIVGACQMGWTVHLPEYSEGRRRFPDEMKTTPTNLPQLLAQVKQEGAQIRLNWTDMRQTSYMQFSSEDLAARAAFALEFLRNECDATKKYGF